MNRFWLACWHVTFHDMDCHARDDDARDDCDDLCSDVARRVGMFNVNGWTKCATHNL